MIITIDGPAGTGKSTVARKLAKRLGFLYFDTGAMYRSLTWFALKNNIDLHDESAVEKLLKKFQYSIRDAGSVEKKHFVGEEDVTAAIRTPEVTQNVSIIASYKSARQHLVKIQHEFGESGDVVFEGRDMGSVVFPDADLKFFLTADPEVRAERRYLELTRKFPENDFHRKEILAEIIKRDEMDSSRKISPLIQAKDAYLVDTSKLSAEEVLEKIVEIKQKVFPIKKKLLYRFIIFCTRVVSKVFYRLKVYGIENFPKGGGLVIANHTSFYDPPIVAAICPEEVHFLARASLFTKPFFGWFIRKLNAHPVNRDGADPRALRQVHDLLIRGYKVILFPEGARSEDGKLRPFRSGLGFLAYKAKSQIIPIYIDGAHKIWQRGKKFPRLWGNIVCVIGKPIQSQSFQTSDRKKAIEDMTNSAQQAVGALKEWLHKGCKGEIP